MKKKKVKKNEYKFIIIATESQIRNLKNNLIDEYFMDTTYKCVPKTIYNFKLMAIISYDFNYKKTELCCFILIMNEKEFTFYNIFKVLLAKYHFNPKNIM